MPVGDIAGVGDFIPWGVFTTIRISVARAKSVLVGTTTSFFSTETLSKGTLLSLATGIPKIMRERARIPNIAATLKKRRALFISLCLKDQLSR
jgi:hypothetical protein